MAGAAAGVKPEWERWIKESVIVYLHSANVLHGCPKSPQLFYRGPNETSADPVCSALAQ